MHSKFQPPPVEELATVDKADSQYHSELMQIMGVISFSSQGGWHATEDYSVHRFEFASWKKTEQLIIQKPLTILRPVARDCNWFIDYLEGTIHKIRVLLSLDETRAVFFDSIEKNVDDIELQAIADELRQPVTLETAEFGVLTLNRTVNWFEGSINWNGTPVDISFNTGEELDITSELEVGRSLLANSVSWGERINDFAVKEKLNLAQEWQDDGADPITAEEFLNRMKLKSISVHHDGLFEFWHDDGDMFWGHSIVISGSIEGGLNTSDIAG